MKTIPRNLLLATLILVAGVFLGYKLNSKPAQHATTQTVYVDRIEYRDRLVTTASDKVKTTTFSNGTVVVETDKSKSTSEEHSREHVASFQQTTRVNTQPKYSVGIAVGRKLNSTFLNSPSIYSIELGYRPFEAPIWLTTNISTDRTLLLGARFDF